MINERFGCMILISSTAAAYGYSEDVDYIPYKKANEGLTLSTALCSEREKWGVRLYTLAPGDVFNPSTWNSYDTQEKEEAVRYGMIESETIAKIVTSVFSGQLTKRYQMRVNVDTGEVINIGRYVPLKNGDVIIADAKTVPYLFKSLGSNYRNFTPKEY
jgi:NADP-dependent 3-hydroxy acid dehydrogenase YdfG